ncbi:MAG: hypothetical protein IKE69_01470 [Thermoguttaceae bacterium]|nr:hypothetical protein [Thermoguttaceae bacterium]
MTEQLYSTLAKLDDPALAVIYDEISVAYRTQEAIKKAGWTPPAQPTPPSPTPPEPDK